MPQPIKYLIIVLLCLALGALVGILGYTKLSPVELLRKSLQVGVHAADVAKDPGKALQAMEPKKDDKEGGKNEPAKAPGEAKADGSPQKEKPGDDKKDGSKTDTKDDKKPDPDAPEYLRSLWPIKKRKSPDISGPQKGAIYFEGTTPYGPPANYKEDLFSETKNLAIPGDPSPRFTPPLARMEKQEEFPQPDPYAPPPPPSFYQIEVGRFSSLTHALKARDILREKGHEAGVYYKGEQIVVTTSDVKKLR